MSVLSFALLRVLLDSKQLNSQSYSGRRANTSQVCKRNIDFSIQGGSFPPRMLLQLGWPSTGLLGLQATPTLSTAICLSHPSSPDNHRYSRIHSGPRSGTKPHCILGLYLKYLVKVNEITKIDALYSHSIVNSFFNIITQFCSYILSLIKLLDLKAEFSSKDSSGGPVVKNPLANAET